MGAKRYTRRELPPCPDPHSFILVKTSGGYYWRRKRGTMSPAPVNRILKRNASTARITAPAASRLLALLEPYTRELRKGGLHLKLSGLLMRTYHDKNFIDFSLVEGLELNAGYPLDKLFSGSYEISNDGGSLQLSVQLHRGCVKKKNVLATDFYFEAVLVCGFPAGKKRPQVFSESSPLYSFDTGADECSLIFSAPPADVPWMLLLKVACLEGNEMAAHPMHYGMKVVGVGSGEL